MNNIIIIERKREKEKIHVEIVRKKKFGSPNFKQF